VTSLSLSQFFIEEHRDREATPHQCSLNELVLLNGSESFGGAPTVHQKLLPTDTIEYD